MTRFEEMEREEVFDVLERRNIILMVLYTFHKMGREEISLPEFLECVKRLQEKIPLGYEFFERFLYSSDLMEDLRDLEFEGFSRRFTYRHDAFLPKSYIVLTDFGRLYAKKIAQRLRENYILTLEDSVNATIQSYQEKWKMYARPVR